MEEKPGSAAPGGQRRRRKHVAFIATILLLALLAVSGYPLLARYRVGQEIRQYVGGPFGRQLLYLQTCAADSVGGGAGLGTLEMQLRSCQSAKAGRQAGYYVYDFNTRRSLQLTERDIALWKGHEVLAFPETVEGRVRNSASNPVNGIILFEEFAGFDFNCIADAQSDKFSCELAPATCELRDGAVQCRVFNPQSEQVEFHSIEKRPEIERMHPQGFITGPDLFKLLKPRFFPVLE